MTTVDRVKLICREQSKPISKLERECGFSNGYINSLKRGTMPAERLQLVAENLGVSYEYLLTGKVPEPEAEQMREVRMIARAGAKMPPEKRKEMMRVLKAIFPEEFKDYEE